MSLLLLALQLLFIGWFTNIILFHLDTDRCPWCGQPARMEFVRGHYECSTCRRPIMDCCDGEQACLAVKLAAPCRVLALSGPAPFPTRTEVSLHNV